MIRAFFEGPAGSGKTHHLIDEAVSASGGVFVDPGQKLLALTFMNGSRHRLNYRFRDVPQLRGRFVCLTFDSFAGMVARRRRSLLRELPDVNHPPERSEFDRTCIDAARLLELPAVAAWIAASYPLVVVDEAQDLNPHRFRLLKALEATTCLIAAADEFQNLYEDIDARDVVSWLKGAERPNELTQIRRTSRNGLLLVADALRSGADVCGRLQFKKGRPPSKKEWHEAAGVRLIEAPATNAGIVAWAVANELRILRKHAVILTSDAKSDFVQEVLQAVETKSFSLNKKKGSTFGPFPLSRELRHEEEAADMLTSFESDGVISLRAATQRIAGLKHPACPHICERLERARNVRGETEFSQQRLGVIVGDVLRDIARHHPRAEGGRRVMTIHQAKNREFQDVLVMWPHSAMGSPEQLRRLLYNAVTRAKECCSIVVFGQGRRKKPPFA
jgi:superfamily I DNA/RNA helicase